MVRYLVSKMVVGGAAINLALNAGVGWVVFREEEALPLWGAASVAADTLIGLLVIGLLTMLIVPIVVRRDARAGRVAGLGWTPTSHPWLAWLPRRPVARSVMFGCMLALLGGSALLGLLVALDVAEVATRDYVWIKGLTAASVAAFATPVAALLALAEERDATADPRRLAQSTDLSGTTAYPFDYLDKGCLAATSVAHGCSNTPTWQLVVEGALDRQTVVAALQDLVARYPSCRTRAHAVDATPDYAREFLYVADPDFRVDDIFDYVELERASDADVLSAKIHNHAIDLFTAYPIFVTLAKIGATECRLYFEQHHAIADGRAFSALLADFCRFLDARGRAEAPNPVAPIGRSPEMDALGLSPIRRLTYGIAGFLWSAGVILRAMVRPTTPQYQNLSNDYTGGNATIHWVVSDEALERWRPARTEIGVSLDTLLTGALFLASARWNRELGVEPGWTNATLTAETRPCDREFQSFANHLSSFHAELNLGVRCPPRVQVRALQRQVVGQRDRQIHLKRLVCEHYFARGIPLDKMRRVVFESKHAPFNLSFSNMIPLEFPELAGETWSVRRLLISTPTTPRCGVMLTAIRYNGELVFNFNYKESIVTREQVERLVGHFEAVLDELTA